MPFHRPPHPERNNGNPDHTCDVQRFDAVHDLLYEDGTLDTVPILREGVMCALWRTFARGLFWKTKNPKFGFGFLQTEIAGD
jgi:hypothetical protein